VIIRSDRRFNDRLPIENHVNAEEEIKKLLVGEPHVGVSLPLEAELEGQRLLLGILSEKKDMESLHLTVPMRFGYFSKLEYSLSELEKINANNPKLHDLTLVIRGEEGMDLFDEDVHALVAVLKENRALQSLSLESLRINAVIVRALTDAMKENRLHSLDLSDVPLDAAGMQALADALKENHSLHSLNLSDVPLDAAGMQALVDALKESHSLQSLNLSGVPLDAAGMQALADGLKGNRSLQSLDLSGVAFDAAGMQALAEALKENHSLHSLDLSDVPLDAAGMQALAEALKKNTTLEVLNVSGNRFCDGMQALVFALKENETLHSLVLTGTFYSEAADRQRLVDALSKDLAARIHL